jgi:hypothetical protein
MTKNETPSRIDKFLHAASLMACILLVFMAGAVVTAGEIFPGPQIAQAYQGGRALYDKLSNYPNVYRTDLWYPQRDSSQGVTVHAPDKARQGVTLLTSAHEPAAVLVDMDGNVLHKWHRPFSTVWEEGPPAVWTAAARAGAKPQPDPFVYFRHAYVYPNGDLLALYEGAGDTPYGYGLVKLDRNSKIIWRYPGRAHHQFSVAPDGKIYVLTHEISHEKLDWYGHLKPPRLDDFLVVLSPDGEELHKIHLIKTFIHSQYRQLGYSVSNFAVADPLHANAVDYIGADAAARFAFGEEGQVLLSFREFGGGSIAVLDLETENIVWATKGPWGGQHDPDILPNGNVLLFDNFGNFTKPEGQSRVIEFDPRTMQIVWSYAGTPERPLDSPIRSEQQRLANGNTLITESNLGRVLEVTPEGEIVWEYVNPVRGGEEADRIPVIGWALRLDPTTLDPTLLRPPQPSGPANTETPT